jgi:quercetin dioxygenase-like cupin family protein
LQQRDAYATVLEEVIRCQVNDEPVTTYTAGQSFSKLPGDRHNVSANANQTKPASSSRCSWLIRTIHD